MPDTILSRASEVVNGPRADDYGDPWDQYRCLADLWSAYLGCDISPLDCVNMMLLVKIQRVKNIYHHDSYVDIAGYAEIAGRMGARSAEEN